MLATSTTLAAAGLIGSSSDVDVYRFAAGPGAAAIDVKSASVGPDLDILAELRDSAGNLIASSNPADSLSAHLGQTLASGTYYLTVRGTGKGSPLDVGGYSNYASIGRYTVSGTVAAVTPAAEPVFSPAGGTFTGSVDVAMTCATAGATIRYTTDGTTPTSASPTYAGVPLHLTSTARLQAVAFEPGWSPSALHAETYTIVPGPFQIAVSASTNGTITPPGVQTVSYGSSKTFAITPVSGYHIVRVLVDGTSIGASSSVTFSNVAANHTLSASFASAYSVVPSAAAHGAISPNTAQTIAAGGDVTFAVTPDSAYRIADVLVDGASVGASASVTLHHVAADHTVSATFWPVSVFQTVWRFRNPGSGYYLWTADPAEKDHIVAALPGTWIFEGPAYPIDVTSPLNNSPLWRFRNLKSDFYLYTADPVEKASIITNLAASWRFEGAAYSVERVFTTGSQTVWRFRNTRDGSYFFTADPAEKDRIIAKLAAAWKYEGPSFFLAP